MTVTPDTESSSGDNVHWIFKNKDHGKTSATASLVRLFQGQTPTAVASTLEPPIDFAHCIFFNFVRAHVAFAVNGTDAYHLANPSALRVSIARMWSSIMICNLRA